MGCSLRRARPRRRPRRRAIARLRRAPELPSVEVVTSFIRLVGSFPEGVSVAAGVAYVAFSVTGEVARVDIATGQTATFGQVPAPGAGAGFVLGLAVDAVGDVYAAVASGAPQVDTGIYRIPSSGGAAKIFAKHQEMKVPNAMVFDAKTLYVSDSSGSVFRIEGTGEPERWATADELAGSKDFCGQGVGSTFNVGANGIAVDATAVYVANTDKATIVRIPKLANGTAGPPEIVVGPDCENLRGADGLAIDSAGNFIVAVNSQDKIVRVAPNGTVTTLAAGGDLDAPASVAISGSTLFVTNWAYARASAGQPAHPSLVRLELDQ